MVLEALPGEMQFFDTLVVVWVVVAAVTFLALQFLVAPYGRHHRAGWGPTVHRTLGWVVMEAPAVFVFAFFLLVSPRRAEVVPLVFTAIWMLHYVNRTFIFPFRMRGGQLRMPWLIVGMGFFFNLVNGYVQARYLFTLGPARGTEWLLSPAFLAGVAVFAVGHVLNQHSDSVLRNLREHGDTHYEVPHGGGYRFVSCPNYLGELLEWTGWALLTWSVSGLLFLVWTAANLLPRARAHHRWYHEEFSDYPRERKALIPFLY